MYRRQKRFIHFLKKIGFFGHSDVTRDSFWGQKDPHPWFFWTLQAKIALFSSLGSRRLIQVFFRGTIYLRGPWFNFLTFRSSDIWFMVDRLLFKTTKLAFVVYYLSFVSTKEGSMFIFEENYFHHVFQNSIPPAKQCIFAQPLRLKAFLVLIRTTFPSWGPHGDPFSCGRIYYK